MNILDNVNLESLKEKLYENLKESGWADKLKTFIRSNDFDIVLTKLLHEAKAGDRFTPILKQVFRAFEECPIKDLKIVILNNEPNQNVYVADGLAFSCGNLNMTEGPLKIIFKTIDDTIYKDGRDQDPDLKRWANQGILLLNTSLTTRIHRVGLHYELWKPFISFLFDYLIFNHPDVIYVAMGKKAEPWLELLPEETTMIAVPHPSFAKYRDDGKWECDDLFNKLSDLTYKKFNKQIIW